MTLEQINYIRGCTRNILSELDSKDPSQDLIMESVSEIEATLLEDDEDDEESG